MTESILNTIKQMLGIPTTDTAFDTDVITNINAVFMTLNQIGIGPETVYSITGITETWSDFLTDPAMYSGVKTYMYLKVRVAFDPPGTSYLLDAMKNQILEWEWRLSVQVPVPPDPVVPPVEP
jgi:hypothetical protein